MSAKTITYDPQAPGRDYTTLFDAIKAFGAWCHIAESVWIVVTEASVVEIRDALLKVVDGNDLLVVLELSGTWACANVLDTQAAWLKKNL